MTHHYDRVSLCSVSGRDLLIRQGLHMTVMSKKAMSRKLDDADEHNIFVTNNFVYYTYSQTTIIHLLLQ